MARDTTLWMVPFLERQAKKARPETEQAYHAIAAFIEAVRDDFHQIDNIPGYENRRGMEYVWQDDLDDHFRNTSYQTFTCGDWDYQSEWDKREI